MSNTGRNKKLASFNCDEQMWAEFVRRCQEQGTTATATLTRFIQLYLDGKLDDNLDADMMGARFEQRIKASVEEYLEKQLPLHLDKYLATGQDKQLYSTVVALSEKIGSLEARLSTTLGRTYPQKTNPSKEREFWFIQDRARYLGVTINADQRLKIEMFANANYQERHGQLPKRQPYRGTQDECLPSNRFRYIRCQHQGRGQEWVSHQDLNLTSAYQSDSCPGETFERLVRPCSAKWQGVHRAIRFSGWLSSGVKFA